MKKLVSTLLALCLLLSCFALAESEENAVRVTADNVSITFGDDSFDLSMSASLDVQAADDRLNGAFVINRGERELLPVAASLAQDGAKLRLGSSSVYHFTPEFFFGEGEPSAEGYRTLITALPELDDVGLLYSFRDYLDAQQKDRFTLTGDELLGWLNGALAEQNESLPELLAWMLWNEPVNAEGVYPDKDSEETESEEAISEEGFTLDVERTDVGWQLSAGDAAITLAGADAASASPAEEAALTAIGGVDGPASAMIAVPAIDGLKDSAASVALGEDPLFVTSVEKTEDEATSAFLIVDRTGGFYICMQYEYHNSNWRTGTGMELYWKPTAEGAEFSFVYGMEDSWEDITYFSPDTATRLAVTGAVIDGNLNADVEYLHTSSAVSDLKVTFDVTSAPCVLRDDLSGNTVVVTDSLNDTGSVGLTLAAMGLMGDLESILSDEVISGITNRWSEMYATASEAFYAQLEKLEPTVDDLSYAVPEFTWLPEGFEITETSVSDYSDTYWLTCSDGEDTFDIRMMPEEDNTVSYSFDENGNLVEQQKPSLEFETSDSMTEAVLTRSGLNIRIFCYHFDEDAYRLTIEDVQGIVGGIVWPEE